MYDNITEWIKIEDCKDGWLYLIAARNSCLGIYDEKDKGFVISRFKFKNNFLFTEYHWDADPTFGTVKPLKILEQAPHFDTDSDKLQYLNEKTKEYKNQIESAGLYA